MNKFIKRLAIFIAIAGVVLGLVASSRVVYEIAGGGGVLLALLFFPLTFVYLPFYTLLVHGSWNLLLLNYGSIAVSWILLNIPDRTERQPQRAADEPPTQPVATTDNPTPAIILLVVGGLVLAAIVWSFIR
jgi:hypothetical protein